MLRGFVKICNYDLYIFLMNFIKLLHSYTMNLPFCDSFATLPLSASSDLFWTLTLSGPAIASICISKMIATRQITGSPNGTKMEKKKIAGNEKSIQILSQSNLLPLCSLCSLVKTKLWKNISRQ